MRTDTNRAICTRAARYCLLLAGVQLLTLPAALGATQADTLWAENWEGDFTDNWFVDNGTWEVGMPTSGPGSAYEGENVGATVLGDNYSDDAPDSRLIRFTPFVVPAAAESPRLRFWHWWSFGSSDYGRVEVSTDGGGSWESVSPNYFSSSTERWTRPFVDLTAYSGEEVLLSLLFHSQRDPFFNAGPGWYVDDIVVLTGPLPALDTPEGWEDGIGGWHADFGTWEVGAPTSGPGSAHTGEQAAATILSGNYSDDVLDSRLISPCFSVLASSSNPSFQFWHWFSFGSSDDGRVEISTDAGGTWETIAGPFMGNSSNIWSFFNASLSPYVGEEVLVSFLFHSQRDPFFNAGPGWYVDDIEVSGNVALCDPTHVSIETGRAPVSFVLYGAFPNPSAATATVAFGLPELAEVTLRMFDVLGREVATATEQLPAGEHRMPWRAAGLASGVYLYRVEARLPGGTEVRSGRLTLLE